jgi:hypothetical protein
LAFNVHPKNKGKNAEFKKSINRLKIRAISLRNIKIKKEKTETNDPVNR